jgi:threonine dehydratase
MGQLVSVEEIKEAAARLDGVAVHTPLVRFPRSSPVLLVKPESLQPVGSFKLRGAYAAISALPPEVRRRGVVTHSSGNHGHAVAYAAARLGVPAVVVVPDTAPKIKTDAIRA